MVDQLIANAGEDLRLGGKEVVGTVMFSDLRGFTSSAEFMPADGVIRVLNHYLHEMSEAILAHGGTLVCYMADGIYALFGAPVDYEDHADRALAAAREMLTERLPAFNEFMREQGLGEGYLMGIGLNTGPVMTGNVGHERRMDYTAVGDVPNTASRIEGMTKTTPYSVLIAESTVQALQGLRRTDIVFYEEQDVRGRKERLKLYALDIKKDGGAPASPAPQRQLRRRSSLRHALQGKTCPDVRGDGRRARRAAGSRRRTGSRRPRSTRPSSVPGASGRRAPSRTGARGRARRGRSRGSAG